MKPDRVLELIRKNGHVSRYHTDRIIGTETIAEHSWGVAMLCIALSEDGNISGRLIKHCLYHDLAEHTTGDIPAPAKWNSPVLTTILSNIEDEFDTEFLRSTIKLSSLEQQLFKIADMLQLCIFTHDQLVMGNQTVQHIYHNGVEYLTQLDYLPQLAVEILRELEQENMVIYGRK